MIKNDINPYEVLGLDKDCSDKDIEKAYHEKSQLVHPDRFIHAEEKAEAQMNYTRLTEARDILLDPVKRKNYDKIAENIPKQSMTNKQSYLDFFGAKLTSETNKITTKPSQDNQSTTEKVRISLLKDTDQKPVKTKEQQKVISGLHDAIESGSVGRVKSFLDKGADVNGKINDSSPLHTAAKSINYRPSIIDLLIKYGADVNLTDAKHQTPAHLAATYGNKNMIEKLLKHHDMNWNIQDKSCDTPLHIALLLPDQEIAEILKKHASVRMDIKNNDGLTASELNDLVNTPVNKNSIDQYDPYQPYEPPVIEPNIIRVHKEAENNNNNFNPPIH